MIDQRVSTLFGFGSPDLMIKRSWRRNVNVFFPERYVRFVMGGGDLMEESQGEFETVMNRSIIK